MGSILRAASRGDVYTLWRSALELPGADPSWVRRVRREDHEVVRDLRVGNRHTWVTVAHYCRIDAMTVAIGVAAPAEVLPADVVVSRDEVAAVLAELDGYLTFVAEAPGQTGYDQGRRLVDYLRRVQMDLFKPGARADTLRAQDAVFNGDTIPWSAGPTGERRGYRYGDYGLTAAERPAFTRRHK